MARTQPVVGVPKRAKSDRGRARRRWLPPQHGAWAMLLVPYLAGLIVVGVSWVDLPLLVAWVVSYLASYYLMMAVKTKRLQRVRPQLFSYGTIALAAAVITIAARPKLLLFAPVLAVVLGINALFAHRRDDRALANGIASVVAACLIVPMTAVVAGTPIGDAGDAFGVCLLFFVGSLLFVKTIFRERDNPRLRQVSAGYHVLALGGASALSLAFIPTFVFLLVRSVALPRRTLRPGGAGIVELIASALLLGTLGVLVAL
jgi:hypothetical protein